MVRSVCTLEGLGAPRGSIATSLAAAGTGASSRKFKCVDGVMVKQHVDLEEKRRACWRSTESRQWLCMHDHMQCR